MQKMKQDYNENEQYPQNQQRLLDNLEGILLESLFMQTPTIQESDIKDWTGTTSFARGKQYYEH
jgi:hypothetical protein